MRNDTTTVPTVFQSTKRTLASISKVIYSSTEYLAETIEVYKDTSVNESRTDQAISLRECVLNNNNHIGDCYDDIAIRMAQLDAVPVDTLSKQLQQLHAERLKLIQYEIEVCSITAKPLLTLTK